MKNYTVENLISNFFHQKALYLFTRTYKKEVPTSRKAFSPSERTIWVTIWPSRFRNPVLRIKIRIILGLLDPDPDPFVRGTDTDPELPVIKQK
jgi:hypothetical protein